ncbi:fluoride efflux transporter CrcB [Chthonobacter albigriseus]|uniref:fluoride efflux transporter CrcB n=1 Tax=Chthonobacter albigriseus TaxID=1683161 RepID=UPI0015EF6212|nr:fluoride efflux transporter CrcB [Chthonobacter albigriseus]
MSPLHLLLVALGGAAGSVCRHLVNMAALRLAGPDFPWGTFAVNVAGSFLMGVFIELLALKLDGSQALRLFVATGFLGGFTTLSSFSLDAVTLWERGAILAAGAYVAGSILLSLAGLVAGLAIVRTLS